ncbi:MAG: nucleotidyl transferase AbiEii/AbiGii toxin family protein [Mollicutes bacterium PWAP]|nr:nucleotidyl transferase AbiEii/AbiGii toxin family protein [Mollicutes bacterium PWAP]
MKKIKTGATALYKQNLISYSPQKDHVEMSLSTNASKYPNLKVSLQNEKTLNIGTINIDGELYYSPERLFIEFNKFKLENTISKEAKKKLLKVVVPEKVKSIYDEIKNKRRGLNKEEIELYLNKRILYIKEKILESNDKKNLLREYVMALVSRKDVPVLIKGGSSIELFTTINRSTLDIDFHASKNSILEILEFLSLRERDIWFKLNEKDNLTIDKIKSGEAIAKPIFKFQLFPVSKGGVLKKELEGFSIPISFNTTYDENELKEIIDNYKITRKTLKQLTNSTAIVFSREMLLAEKFQSIISKPSITTRTKDLIDLYLLWDYDEINFKSFRKWLFRKWKSQRDSKTQEEAIKIIKANKYEELTKIKDNFYDAIQMYDAIFMDLDFNRCLYIYRVLTAKSIE